LTDHPTTEQEVLERYRTTCDMHTHTVYSHGLIFYNHGKGTVRENAAAAAEKGIPMIAITDHGPGHRLYGVDMNKLPQIRKDIEEAQKAYPDVSIRLGVEANIVDSPNGLDITPEQFGLFDFVIAGYHYGLPHCSMMKNHICSHFGLPSGSTARLRNSNTDMVLRALHENDVKIITHPGDKGPFDIDAISRACEETDTLMEINMKHKHLTVDELRIAAKYDVRFIIDSDAHRPERVGDFAGGVLRACEAGVDLRRIVNLVAR
jgi:putative hydrolase